jgi:Lecithin retinol acyltransferase
MNEEENDTPRAYRAFSSTRAMRKLAPSEIPRIGAHLVTPFMGFAHHGIYVGDDKVVHYGALVYDIIRKPIEEVSLGQFAEGRPLFVVAHADDTLAADRVITRARSRLGEARYRLLTNNCEHFVEWCLHNQHRSYQVELALAFPRLMAESIQAGLVRGMRRVLGWRRMRRPMQP